MASAKNAPTKLIRIGDLSIDTRVQRAELREATLGEIRKDFNPRALGTFVVSLREDGSRVIIDGGHRWTVLMEKLGEDHKWKCEEHVGLSLEEEAELFLELNQQRPPSKLDKHNVAVTQGHPMAVAIKTATEKHGWSVGTGKEQIGAIGALQWIYGDVGEGYSEGFGEDLLANTIAVITGAWGRDEPKAVDQNILKAVAQFLWAVQKNVIDKSLPFDFEHLTESMVEINSRGPRGWLPTARGAADARGLHPRQVLAEGLFKAYNKNPPSGKLPPAVRVDAMKIRNLHGS